MDENGISQNETSPTVEPSTSTKRIKLAPLLITLAIIVLSVSCLVLFWNITSLTLSYPYAEVKSIDWKIELHDCGDYGRALIWVSSVKFLSTDDAVQVESWYQTQGWSDYVAKIYNGVKGGGMGVEQDWQILHVYGVKTIFIDQSEDSSQIVLRTVTSFCLFGN